MMLFNKHSDLEGKHAYLSPSNHHWINYTDEKFDLIFRHQLAKERGVKLHELACQCIRMGVKLKEEDTLGMYVSDAIDYQMVPEQVLYYSPYCFGTADTISYDNHILRIHDLKTGANKAYMHQLEIYAAIFFLEYQWVNIDDTEVELRIYQNNQIWKHNPNKDLIWDIMQNIAAKDQRIRQLKGG